MGLGKKQARRPHHAAGARQILIDPDVVPRRFASWQGTSSRHLFAAVASITRNDWFLCTPPIGWFARSLKSLSTARYYFFEKNYPIMKGRISHFLPEDWD
ncbi:hypothetical protein [Thermodesulfomicrobium sp. WS]|uniref:hypothetical protein n=1 Tax=Thermodesulfomicrobium sp. WS TaxID=3004129 RepID=UPI0024930F5D|nr:hypothetical protein [Thermodesulfomicrobium sp. WS]